MRNAFAWFPPSLFGLACGALVLAACLGDDNVAPAKDASASDTTMGDAAPSTCMTPGMATPGPKDAHCTDTDGGAIVQPTSMASCHPDAGPSDAGPGNDCPYGDTLYGQESDDDDCKYHVKWTSSAICEGDSGVQFVVTVTNKSDGTPMKGGGTYAETFTTTPGDASCDDMSTHPGKNSGVTLVEGPDGTYTGNVIFDKPGAWTVRFHFHGECDDTLPDSPHGHAAYHLTVP